MIWLIPVLAVLAGVAYLSWDELKSLKGKQVAIIGPRAVGKSTLINFLSNGTIPETYKQTLGTQKAAGRRFQLKELNLDIKDSFDVSGSDDAYAEWEKLLLSADIIIYLIRADLLRNGNVAHGERAEKDLKHVGDWIDELRTKKIDKPFFIIGTHLDLANSSFNDIEKKKEELHDRFTNLQVVKSLVAQGGGRKNVTVILGSMKSTDQTEALVYEIFRQVIS